MTSRALALILAATAASTAHAQVKYTPVALSGQPAPEAQGLAYREFLFPRINNSGQVAFWADIHEVWWPDDGIWTGFPGALHLMARTNQPDQDVTYSCPVVSDSGQVAYLSHDDNTRIYSLWFGIPGNMQLVIRGNTPLPEMGPGMISGWDLDPPVVNSAGQLAIKIVATNGTQRVESIWTGTPGSLQLGPISGQHAPGIAGDVRLGGFNRDMIGINASGQITFLAHLKGAGVEPFLNNTAIYAGPPSAPQLVARGADPAVATTATYQTLQFTGRINAAGQVIYTDLAGLWTGAPGDIKLVAYRGQRAPGLPQSITYKGMQYEPAINDAGQVAFAASLAGDVTDNNDEAIWFGQPGNLRLLAREGDPVPGVPEARFRDIVDWAGEYYTAFLRPQINNHAQVVFWGSIVGPAIDDSNNHGLWATDSDAQIHLIIREGTAFEVAPGDVRIIQSIQGLAESVAVGPLPHNFNDAGQFILHLTFTDESSGLFLATIPEPATPIALTLISLAMLRPSRAHRLQEKHP